MNKPYYQSSSKHQNSHTNDPKSAFLLAQTPNYTRSYYKEDRTSTQLLYRGQSTNTYQTHVNPHFRIPKFK